VSVPTLSPKNIGGTSLINPCRSPIQLPSKQYHHSQPRRVCSCAKNTIQNKQITSQHGPLSILHIFHLQFFFLPRKIHLKSIITCRSVGWTSNKSKLRVFSLNSYSQSTSFKCKLQQPVQCRNLDMNIFHFRLWA